jgi:hypothetical protein
MKFVSYGINLCCKFRKCYEFCLKIYWFWKISAQFVEQKVSGTYCRPTLHWFSVVRDGGYRINTPKEKMNLRKTEKRMVLLTAKGYSEKGARRSTTQYFIHFNIMILAISKNKYES